MPSDPCQFLSGAMKTACQNAQNYAQNGGTSGGIFSGPGSDWWRHAFFRVIEVVVGTALVVVGVKAFISGSDTAKVVVQMGKKVVKT